MADSKRLLIAGGLLFALMAAFWLMLLSPKREEGADLAKKVDRLETEVAQVRQQADAAAEAKAGFADDYEQLVLLGKAVPADDDTASLLIQLDELAEDAGVEFRSLQLSESAATATAPVPTAPAEPAPADPAATGTPAATTVPATETTAASLPIGATIGSAGLGVMPYELEFKGQFFEIADFIKGLDSLVKTENGSLTADGRLITIDGFALTADQDDGFPNLTASVAVTTYLAPSGQGLTAGATPVAPAPVAPDPSTAPVATTP